MPCVAAEECLVCVCVCVVWCGVVRCGVPSFAWFYIVLLSFAKPHLVLPHFHWFGLVLLSFPWLHLVFPGLPLFVLSKFYPFFGGFLVCPGLASYLAS